MNDYQKECQEVGNIPVTPKPNGARHIVIDTETTGFDPYKDEILQLSILDADTKEMVFDEYFRPAVMETWPDAERVNHISPGMVANRPTLKDRLTEINSILASAETVIGYNTPFDTGFLTAYGAKFPNGTEYSDVMRDFAPVYGEWNEYYGDYKWKSLSVCAEYFGYDWGNTAAHNSLSDCLATLHCYVQLQNLFAKEKAQEVTARPSVLGQLAEISSNNRSNDDKLQQNHRSSPERNPER